MPNRYIEGVYPDYIEKGDGAYIYANDKRYIDYPLGLGTIILGHGNGEIKQAIIEQWSKGVSFPIPHEKETILAEMIVEMIPSAEKVRFLKTGSEATSAAVKIARAFTGKKKILCCGYHGWHDWYASTTDRNAGCIGTNVKQLEYNDKEAFTKEMNRGNVAGVIIEPYVYDKPKNNFLVELRKLCNKHKAVLIFDEVVTGFRTERFSAQALLKVTPDLTCLGKAMANGLPISCVCGKAEIMDVIRGKCFVSSTFGGELLSITAAITTLEFIKENNVPYYINRMGDRLKNGFNGIAQSMGFEKAPKCIGYPCRTAFVFSTPEQKSLFWQECFKKGIFFGWAQFMSFAHTVGDIDETLQATRHALKMVRKYWKDPTVALEGKVAQETIR
jgi:glutamate-1-semialdehyde aminotransferase